MEILQFLQELHHPLWNKVMIFITTLGNAGFIWIVIALVLTLRKDTRRTGLTLGLGLVLCLVLGNLFLKNIFARPRPFHAIEEIEPLIKPPVDYSFPSGHTMASFTAAFIIFFRDRTYGAWALILAGLIGFSRLYLQVHYPGDVLGGIVIAYLFAVLAEKIMSRIRERKGEVI